MFFRKKDKTYIIDEQTLSDSRCTLLIEKEIFTGRFILIPYPIYEVIPANINRDENNQKRLNENIERIKTAAQGRVRVYNKQLNKQELIKLAIKNRAAIIVSNDESKNLLTANLPQSLVAGAKIVNLNDLYEILKPGYLPGSEFKVVVSKKGKEHDEGIGYLDGGIKVVIAGGARSMGKELEVVVQGSIETNVGKLIFVKPKYEEIR
ncbi:MAG: TRAM domain-containing protein [Candidatus Latescibacteria bacterium]|nr:TRAM domain-containing protein [Candidatus Latescibacterota bacterium]